MKSKIYTFREKKKVFVEVSSFVEVKSKKQFESLLDSLLDIDAVAMPDEDFTFPCVIKIENNTFAPQINPAQAKGQEISSVKEIKKQIKDQNIKGPLEDL